MRNTKRFQRITGALAVAGLAVMLSACSSASDAEGGAGSDAGSELTPVRAIVAPIQFETAYLAEQEGFFADAGLDVEILTGADGGANAARVIGGDADLTMSSWTAMVSATSTGLGLNVVMGNGIIAEDQVTSGILVAPDSDIKTIADLEGRTVAVQSPGTGTDIPLLVAAEEAGIEASSMSLANIPYSGMEAALEQGQVDAAFPSSQFYFQMLDAGYTQIAAPSSEYLAGQPATLWAGSSAWLKENPGTAAAFVTAMTRAIDFYNENPDAARAVNAEVVGVSIDEVPKEVARMQADIEVKPSTEMIDYLKRFEVVENPLTFDEIVWVDAPRR